MPQLGETVTEGTIIRWLKNVGDAVVQDEPLFEVSTDKVDSDVPSPFSGHISEILVPEGATVDVGTKLAVVTEAVPLAGPAAAAAPAVAVTAAPAAPTAAAPAPAAPASPAAAGAPPALADLPPAAEAVLASAPSAQEAELPERFAPGSQAPSASEGTEANGKGMVLSPVVRQLVSEYDIDPTEITGTGKGGRVTRADVLAYIDRRAAASAAGPTPATAPRAAAAPPAPLAPAGLPVAGSEAVGQSYTPVAGPRDEVVPFTKIRRLTAEHMVRSKATSAHTLVVIEADFEKIERVRSAHKALFRKEEGIGLTYLPFIVRAVVETLHDYPQLNASVGDDALVVHRDVNLGIAVDLDQRGLIVPVVRNAENQSLRGLARAMAELAERARTRRLSADDVVGGTFTITNPGPFGTFLTAPIINQPQVAILSTDGIKRRPVVITAPDGTEAVGIHSVGMLALSFDHRAVDGAYASAFLHALAGAIESRDWEAEL
jgi:2-oxoglutarate dehydrogenase E2 component (dihydrolipoamide succinyltransferase)